MTPYIRNRNCQCVRCRANGLMGAAVLITLGVLFLLESYNVVPFDRSFPVLLLVIGCMLLVSRTGSAEGHVQPGWIQSSGVTPPGSQPWVSISNVPPQAQPQQSTSGTENPPSSSGQNDSQVKP
ncbi:MAG: LiaI-LiaF-like domain-containing protein [Candidatus Angelobacter sp.]